MKYYLKKLSIAAIFIFIAVWTFHYNSIFIENTNRYLPLANGWVSYHAGKILQKEEGILKKIISDDLDNGRFRPAFTLYVTLPYALSPIVHHRSSTAESRSYNKLVNGDLQLFSMILLGSVALSMILLSLLIYQFTGEMIFSLIPVFFIPLSPSLTENMLQNYIDSQDIPLVLWLSIWIYLFFISIKIHTSFWKAFFLLISIPFLIVAFLTKETSVVISVVLFLIISIRIFISKEKNKGLYPYIVTFLLSIFCSISVYLIVSYHRSGYAVSYNIENISYIIDNLKKLWLCLSKFTLNSVYGYIPAALFIIIFSIHRKEKVNGISNSTHIVLFSLLLLLSCAFFLILAPWQPILIKYVFPSIFFLSFTVALSLSLLTAWAKKRYGKAGYLFYIVIFMYAVPYNMYYAAAVRDRNYWNDQATYGVSSTFDLADSISKVLKDSSAKKISIFIENDAAVAPIPWAKLHLMRILNLDKGVNLIKNNGERILNYEMPKAELSSFREYKNRKNIYLSNKKKELDYFKFDVIYKGYTMKEQPISEFAIKKTGTCYKKTKERINWQGISGAFEGFSLHKYLPADC